MITARRLYDHPCGDREYHLDDGRRLRLSYETLCVYSETDALRVHGVRLSSEPLPVVRDGRVIGTLPADFDWRDVKSTSFLYDPRPGDFKREGDVWVACKTLGGGDFDCIPQFCRIGA